MGRFLLILKFSHLIDNRTLAPPGHPDYDPCAKFDFFVIHANKVFREEYTPHRQLSIDESLVGTHWQSSIKRYRQIKNTTNGASNSGCFVIL